MYCTFTGEKVVPQRVSGTAVTAETVRLVSAVILADLVTDSRAQICSYYKKHSIYMTAFGVPPYRPEIFLIAAFVWKIWQFHILLFSFPSPSQKDRCPLWSILNLWTQSLKKALILLVKLHNAKCKQ